MSKGGEIYKETAILYCQVNNFQAVLVRNGSHSFAIFKCNQFVWTTVIDIDSEGTEDRLGSGECLIEKLETIH